MNIKVQKIIAVQQFAYTTLILPVKVHLNCIAPTTTFYQFAFDAVLVHFGTLSRGFLVITAWHSTW